MKMALLSSLLLIIVLSTLHPAVCQGTGVISVYINSSLPDGEYNCTFTPDTAGHIVCPNLTAALINCKSNLTADLNFVIVSENQFLGQSLTYEVVNSVSLQGNGMTVYCEGFSLEFVSGGHQSFLSFDNITFYRCGNGSQVGFKISVMNSLNMNLVTFDVMFGITLQNIANLTIVSSTFQNSIINPFAVLRIEYDSFLPILINEVTVTLTGCRFFQNIYDNTMFFDTRNSGQLAVLLYQVAAHNFIFAIDSCNFTSTSAPRFSPMFLLLNVTDSSVLVNIDGLRYVSNKQGLLIEMENLNNSSILFFFNQSLFLSNTNDPNLANDSLLTVNSNSSVNSYSSVNETIIFHYNGLNFTNNYGMIMYASSVNANATHILNECLFNGNHQALGAQTMFSFYGSGIDVILSNMHNFSDFLGLLKSPTDTRNNAIVFVRLANSLTIDNVDFTGASNSIATMLSIDTVNEVIFKGLINFYSIIGVHGGALFIRGSTRVTITNESVITFYNNYADYGGAMYINTTDFNNALRCHGRINFINNHARVAGPSIYTTDSNVSVDKLKNCFNKSQYEIATAPKIFNTAIAISNRPFFPGQSLMLNVSLVDGLNNPGSCKADITLECNRTDTGEHGFCEQLYPNVNLQLVGPSDIFLFGTNGVVNTLLPFFQVHFNVSRTQTNATLHVACVDPPLPSMKVNFIWTSSCPLGFIINNDTTIKTYRCTCTATENDHIFCPPQSSVACIKIGYWVNGTTFATVKCPYPLCNFSYPQDTIDANICQQYYGQHVVALPQYENDQCSTHRAGTACLQCQKDYNLTFLGTKCTGNCRIPLHPILISLFTVTFQFLIALFILVAVRTKLKIGAGFVYGPLIFLAIIGQMPLGYNPQYHVLKIIVSSVTSVYLVNLEIFGEIPWCFGIPDSKLLLIKSFYYLGPVLMWLILLLLVVMGRKCPRLLSKLQDSPVQAICLLMMLSFWSMTDTSIHMLKPLQIGDTWYCNDDPNIKYFRDGHIAVGLIAIAILTFAIVPFVALLAMSNFAVFNRIFRLHRFKPIFDEFQSCYVDKHRWYCVVYYISFIIYLMLVEYPPGTEYPLGPPLLLLLLISLHFIIQPYKKHTLNIIDMLLLLDLLVLYFVLERDAELSKSNTFSTVLVHMLTLIPLLYIVVGSIGVLSLQCIHKIKAKTSNYSFGSIQWKSKKSSKEKVITQTEVIVDDSEGEREPLIHIIQNN